MADSSKDRTGFDTAAVVLGGLAAAVFVLALFLFLEGGFLAARQAEHRAKVLEPVNEILDAHRAEQQALLDEGPRWLDEERTRACIPVEAAMDRLVERERSATSEEGN